jgi:hypothetical protein
MQNIPYCMYNCLPEEEPKNFETCRRQQKLKINWENYAFRFFMLCKQTVNRVMGRGILRAVIRTDTPTTHHKDKDYINLMT